MSQSGFDFSAPAPAQPPVPAATPEPCSFPWTNGAHRCRIGGGMATFSSDHGRSWVCRAHLPGDFWQALGRAA